MKRVLSLLSVLTLLVVGLTPARAANDYSKCPDTWKLATSDIQALQKELDDAKILLGTNLAVSITSREILDSGIWRVYSTDKLNNPNDTYWLPLLQLPMRTNYKIEVKGCPAPLNVSVPFSLGNLSVVKSSYSTLYEDMLRALPQSSSPGDLSSRIKSFNFKQLEDSISLLKETVEANKRDLLSGRNATIRGTFKYSDGVGTRSSVLLSMKPVSDQIIGGIYGGFQLLPERLNCVVLSASIISSAVQGPFKWIPAGTSCNYQLVAYLPIINTIFQIDSVLIETATTEITCVKGKTTKKVKGVNPKCPKGYKKK
jgi:hypothetical protein